MPDSGHASRRWNAFVCPECRQIFRVPGHHDGKGVVCPGCRRMLRLPEHDSPSPPLVVPLPEPRRRRRSGKRADEFDETFAHKKESPPWLRWAIVASFATVFTIFALGWILRGGADPAPVSSGDSPPETIPSPAAPTPKAPDFQQLEAVIKAFLEAPTAEDLLAHIRHADLSAPRIRASATTYSPPGFRSAAWNFEPIRQGDGLGIMVETGDFTERIIWVVKENGAWKVDWESWSGWCATPWDKMSSEKPAGTHRLRALAAPAEYFNFNFTDDFEWLCFRLRHPESEETLYGYVLRQSELGAAFQALEPGEQPVIIDVSFPPDSPADNQLLIEAMPSTTWLETTPSP